MREDNDWLKSQIDEWVAILSNKDIPSIRDWFAAMALPGIVTIPDISVPEGRTYSEVMAKYAYDIADAMLEAREARE